ncbi:MAG: hypothetical protein CMJ48_08150 [Planctomycetaceae bacterium]|nr:hypothetical protein [Planctomycetaceae bacterium]
MSVRPIDALKQMAKSFGVAKQDLLVLAPANDPFNSGTATNVVMAEWFAGLLDEHDLPPGKHLRRHHYLLSTLDEPVNMPDGKPYENTDSCWSYLQTASSHARYQGLVDPSQFRDQRNPEAKENQPVPRDEPEPFWEISDYSVWDLPSIPTPYRGSVILPDIYVEGYDYDDGDQPYHLEIWIEKSTMDAELDPICAKYRVTKKQGVGFDSVTSVIKMLERCQAFMEMGRPIRIFYISDFDPAGFFMPQAIARQIQFWLWREGRTADIRLKPLVLTKAQVEEFDLPRKPIKDEDRRKRNFEARLGEGHVELDALAALHPGEFERIVAEAFEDYRDPYLGDELGDAYSDAMANAGAAWEDATEHLRSEVEELADRMNAIGDRYVPKVNKLREALEAELAPLKTEMRELEQRADEELVEAKQRLDVDLPQRPNPDPPAKAEFADWLYDSTRTYGEQVKHFHSYKDGEL